MQDTARVALEIDPVTLEVIRHALVSIANQIDANIKRTAFSAYIYEYNDFAVGLTDADGMLVAQCTGGMPPFVADSVGMAVRDGLSIYGRERLHHGDVVLCNHAAVQGQHLNNTVMYTRSTQARAARSWLASSPSMSTGSTSAAACRTPPTSSWRGCSFARSSSSSAASRWRRFTASSRTTPASRSS
jgi:hypothetical protein